MKKLPSLGHWFTLGLLIWPIVLALIVITLRIGFKLEINYNEGWNAYHSLQAISGASLYNAKQEWIPVNYPPLSFYIVGIVGKILGDPLFAGRWISFLSLLMISIGVGYIVKTLRGSIYDAIFAGIACLGWFVLNASNYVGMNDPGLLGHVFLISALVIYLQYWDANRKLFLVALTVTVGLFIKHTLLPIPMAITIDLFFTNRKNLGKWLLYITVIMALFILFTYIISGNDFITQLLIGRIYIFQKAKVSGWILWDKMQIPLVATLPWAVYALQKERLRILSVYLLISVAIGIYTSGAVGTNINMFFDVFIAASICMGMLISYLRQQVNVGFSALFVTAILPLILCLKLFGLPNNKPTTILQSLKEFQEKEHIFVEDAHFIAQQNGSAICESILVCYFAKKKFEYDPFLTSTRSITKEIDESKVLNSIESGNFKVIQLRKELEEKYVQGLPYTSVPTPSNNEKFTENFFRAVGTHYVLTRKTDISAFYTPKSN